MQRTRLFLVDDQPDMLRALRRALEPEFAVVGVADSGRELLSKAPTLRPHVIVLDVAMRGMSGIEAAERIRLALPDVKIVMLSMHADDVYVAEAMRAGASAYVLKTMGTSELAKAIREVRAGHRYLPSSLQRPG